jgi:hypothetical protein
MCTEELEFKMDIRMAVCCIVDEFLEGIEDPCGPVCVRACIYACISWSFIRIIAFKSWGCKVFIVARVVSFHAYTYT